jgi:NAD(P)-dependent dehydrogenase (short-subunit alcohol dehydrogenase family)
MGRIFITGSADGIGQAAARELVAQGHEVVLHGRSRERAQQAMDKVPEARTALVGDVSSIGETRRLADEANSAGPFQAIIHNAGVYVDAAGRQTVDGLNEIFAVNALAPYILTALIEPPERLVYVSSGLHGSGDPNLSDLVRRQRRWRGSEAYANSKLFEIVLAFAVARLWPPVKSNAVDPGWVRSKMGGPSATVSLEEGAQTPVWLAVSGDSVALVSGQYFYRKRARPAHPAASDVDEQNGFLDECERITGVKLPMSVTTRTRAR